MASASSIKSYKDLAGKTIAVNSINNIGDVTISDVLARHGVNPATVKYVEMGFSEMPAALKQGRVDAIWANEPFLTGAKAEGARIIFSNFEEYDPKLTVAAYFTTKQYATSPATLNSTPLPSRTSRSPAGIRRSTVRRRKNLLNRWRLMAC
jgi:NitT/TauT family transport system substrate-binding protein